MSNETLYGKLTYRCPAYMNTHSGQWYDGGTMKRSDDDVSYRQVGKKSGMASSRMKFQVTILNKILHGGRDYAPALT